MDKRTNMNWGVYDNFEKRNLPLLFYLLSTLVPLSSTFPIPFYSFSTFLSAFPTTYLSTPSLPLYTSSLPIPLLTIPCHSFLFYVSLPLYMCPFSLFRSVPFTLGAPSSLPPCVSSSLSLCLFSSPHYPISFPSPEQRLSSYPPMCP